MSKVKKYTFRILSISIPALLIFIWGFDTMVKRNARNKIFSSVEKIPYNKVGLLLGTSKYLSNGHLNLYYKYRIEAAIELYKKGKIKFILISGDNSIKEYDEPNTMKNDLIKRGIPRNKIFLDYAGFRTLDSIIRAKEIFGQEKITVISQQFHNERAIFIAQRKGLECFGFNAPDVDKYYGLKTRMREKLARIKMILDLATNKKPKFLGEMIEIK